MSIVVKEFILIWKTEIIHIVEIIIEIIEIVHLIELL